MLKKLLKQLEEARAKMAKIREQAGPDFDTDKITEVSGTNAEKLAKIREINDDMASLGKQIETLRVIEKQNADNDAAVEAELKAGRPGFPGVQEKAREHKTEDVGATILKGMGLVWNAKEGRFDKPHAGPLKGEMELKGFHLKTLFERSAGWDPEVIRSGRLVDYPVRPIQVLDILPLERTSTDGIKYMEETTLSTTNAVEKAEGAAYGEIQIAYTERSVSVEKLPAYIPVTDEQLADVPQVQSILENRLGEAVRRRLDSQSLNGDGSTPNVLGVLNKSGIQETAYAADDAVADHIARGMKDVQVTGRALPSAIIMHPTDYLNERLRKDKNGQYIWGNPSQPGITSMWGLPIAQSDSLTAGIAVVGDFRAHCAFVERQNMVIKMGWVNDDFVKGRNAIVAYLRGAFVWRRATAFNKLTLPAA